MYLQASKACNKHGYDREKHHVDTSLPSACVSHAIAEDLLPIPVPQDHHVEAILGHLVGGTVVRRVRIAQCPRHGIAFLESSFVRWSAGVSESFSDVRLVRNAASDAVTLHGDDVR